MIYFQCDSKLFIVFYYSQVLDFSVPNIGQRVKGYIYQKKNVWNHILCDEKILDSISMTRGNISLLITS